MPDLNYTTTTHQFELTNRAGIRKHKKYAECLMGFKVKNEERYQFVWVVVEGRPVLLLL